MNVKELKDVLKKFDDNLPVVVSGYEDGVDDVIAVKAVTIAKEINPEDYYGHHRIIVDRDDGELAVFLQSNRRS